MCHAELRMSSLLYALIKLSVFNGGPELSSHINGDKNGSIEICLSVLRIVCCSTFIFSHGDADYISMQFLGNSMNRGACT